LRAEEEDVTTIDLLEAFDLTGSYRAAAKLVGCDHHTVARHVRLRDAGMAPMVGRRSRPIDPFIPKIQEMVERSRGLVRADVVHQRIAAMGFEGAERTTRRVVAECKRDYRPVDGPTYRPLIPEPGLWAQWSWTRGPLAGGVPTLLWSCWLPWSRFHVVIPVMDRSKRSLAICIEHAMRRFGGVPTYLFLEDLEGGLRAPIRSAVTTLPARDFVGIARHFGMSGRLCLRQGIADSAGVGSDVAVISDNDLVPAPALRSRNYRSFRDLEVACHQYCARANTNRSAPQRPIDALAIESRHLHPLPTTGYTPLPGARAQRSRTQ
jgi:hypothetical protein